MSFVFFGRPPTGEFEGSRNYMALDILQTSSDEPVVVAEESHERRVRRNIKRDVSGQAQ